jgi:hypothetical protein
MSEVREAEKLLREIYDPNLKHGWLWRVYYLLGDVSFYENNQSAALDCYRRAAALNQGFAPASAMIEYLSQNQDLNQSQNQCQYQSQDQDHNQGVTQTLIAGGAAPDGANAPLTAPSPVASQITQPAQILLEQPQSTPGTISQQFSKIPAARTLAYAGTFLSLVAKIFEIEELAPVAILITLSGMIVDDLTKH